MNKRPIMNLDIQTGQSNKIEKDEKGHYKVGEESQEYYIVQLTQRYTDIHSKDELITQIQEDLMRIINVIDRARDIKREDIEK